jgi:hypothetical protein
MKHGGGMQMRQALSRDAVVNEREYSHIEDLGASDPSAIYISNVYKSQGTGQIRHARWEDNHRQKSSYTNSQQHAFGNSLESQNSRAITTEGLRQKAEEAVGLSTAQKDDLIEMLTKYKEFFSSKPGKCTLMQYSFEVCDQEAIIGNSRAIPFAVRNDVRKQIRQLLDDKVIEPFNSCYINSLTIVMRPGKLSRICLDVRRVNKHMVPDRTKVAPIQELIQRFYGSRYISSIDLSSAFLQIELEHKCRKFTAFLFENEVYQFTTIPYGLRNSLPGFVRALNLTLGTDTSDFALSYVDELVYSPTFSHHLQHFDIVIGKLTKAGFTINASKCSFCRPEITFLGHVISNKGVTPDPKRI